MMCAISLLVCCTSGSDTVPDSGLYKNLDDVSTAEEHLMGFSARLDSETGLSGGAASRITRAVGDGQLTSDLLHEVGFGVYCWYTEGNNFTTPSASKYMLMRNQRVVYNGSLTNPWTYSPAKYWPLNESHKLTFRAYAPFVSYNLVEAVESDPGGTYATGMPLIPVVVKPDDYKNGTQHDPLWGTGRLVQQAGDPTPGEYYDEPDPSALDQSKSKRYGSVYNNMTYQMSGDKRLENDSRDGIIDWYFHHGMACLMINGFITKDPGCDSVIIKRIEIEPLYKQGLLDISSPTGDESEKPWWYDRDGNMTVGIDADYMATTPVVIEIDDPSEATGPVPILSKGLLIIPRYYDSVAPLNFKIVYTVDEDSEELEATGTIPLEFKGNTKYTLGLYLTPETRGLVIDIVQSAFTAWQVGDPDSGNHTVYNW